MYRPRRTRPEERTLSIRSSADLEGLTRIGRIVAETLAVMVRAIRPGISTAELDRVGEDALSARGARPTPRHEYGFPGAVCISLEDEIVHGIPGPRRVRPGDLVTVDVTADLDGYVADAARTVAVGPVAEEARLLAACARAACERGIAAAVAGRRTRDIGRAIERHSRAQGCAVVRDLYGHGTGRRIHEPPSVPSFDDPDCEDLLTPGLVITVEPMVTRGSGEAVLAPDGWTMRTADRLRVAHYEETIVVTRGEPIVLTRAA